MKKLELKEMENVEGGCPGIGCSRFTFGFVDLAICYDLCSGEIRYIEPW
jgi:hypothetical protein